MSGIRLLSDIVEEVRLNAAPALVKISGVNYVLSPNKNTYQDMITGEDMVILKHADLSKRETQHFRADTEAELLYWL